MKNSKIQTTYALICVLCTFVSLIIQVLTAAGFPLGEFSLGGTYSIAPYSRRYIHFIFAVLWFFVTLAYLHFANIKIIKSRSKAKNIIVINTLFIVYAIFGNFFITNSTKERFLMGPITVTTAIFSFLLLKKIH